MRRIRRVFSVLLILFIAIVFFIRSPWGQDFIVTKVVNYVSDKTKTEVSIDRLFVTFSGNVYLEGLYLEDTKGDTLIYSKSLEANLPFPPIILGNGVDLKSLEWEGIKANISREQGTESFNFDFLIEAFTTQDSVASSKETEAMSFDIGSISLTDFEIDYIDRFLGIDSKIRIGKLRLDIDEFDLENMRFEVDDIILFDTDLVYNQTRPFPVTEDTTETQLPYVSIENFELKNVNTTYSSISDSLVAKIDIGSFLLELPKADLSKNDFEIAQLVLKNSAIFLKTAGETSIDTVDAKTKGPPFRWPDYTVSAEQIDFEENKLTFQSGKQKLANDKFDPSDLALTNIGLKVNKTSYGNQKANLKLETFSFKDKSGFQLKKLAIDAKLEDTSAKVSRLELQTKHSALFGSLALQFPSIQQFIDAPNKTSVDLEIQYLNLDLRDAFLSQPDLAENEYINKVAKKPFIGRLYATGTLDAIQLADTRVAWGGNTSLSIEGQVFDLIQTDSLSFDFKKIKVTSNREDVLRFVSEEDLGVSVPETIIMDITGSGSIDDIDVDALVKIPEGTTKLVGAFKNRSEIEFSGNLKVDSLQLDKLLKNEQLGAISFNMTASGRGNSINTLNANLDTDFSQLEFNGYDFSNLNLSGDIVNGKGDINLDFKDENLNFKATTLVDLDTIASDIKLDLNVIGADLFALGITRENIKVGTKVSAHFAGNPTDFNLNASFDEGVAVYDNEQYQMGNLKMTAKIDSTITDVAINSDFLNGDLLSNGSPDEVNAAFQKQFQAYFSDTVERDSITKPIELKMNLSLKPTPILTKVFLQGMEKLDSIALNADFNASTKKLNAELHMPSAVYNGSVIDGLNVQVIGGASNLDFTAGLAGFTSGPIDIKKTFFRGNLKNKKLLLDFISYDETEKLLHIASEMTLAKDTINLRINPSELVFNKKEWTIPQDNSIIIGNQLLRFQNVKLTRNAQELTVSNSIDGIEKEHLGIVFDNFKLQTFISLLNPEEELVSGLVKGKLIVENPFGATGIVADFKIKELKALDNPLGDLSLKAESIGLSEYNFNLSLKDGGIDMDLTGDYAAAETGAQLNLNLDLNKLKMKTIEGLSNKVIRDSEGAISGNIKVTGTTENPQYEGKLAFINTDFKVVDLNAVFKITDETLRVDNSGLYLDDFQINDANGNSFTADGTILTKSITNPSFDFALKANRFQVMNSTAEDNALFYGEASLDADITVRGDLSLPIIKGKMKVGKITDITYVVPESQLDVEEREGVVIFVNRENPDAILTRNDQEETPSLFRGLNVNTVLEVAEDAVFHIIIDKRTGDNLKVSGDAALNLNIDPNGKINLTGRYELASGHYETSLYNLVKRRFEINPGSTIAWLGDPTDAKLDVTAVYSVETSAAPLMTAVTSGQDASVTGKFRQVLPFLVYLNVDGELLEPKLSFGLDMPEDEQGSLGGAVYGRVQQLNEQESELNKQVFSLLALNRFFPDSGSDGSGGGAAAIARDNVNKVLSGELNAFSDKVFGNSGFELDFDLDSFTDYQGDSPQDRTQLNINAKKKLFNDRLVVTTGSAVDVEGSAQQGQGETPIIGTVSLEYLLTENGRYRLKGFRKNEYTNVIDGQLILTGVALIFNREFNRFSELFNPLKNAEDGKKKTEGENRIENTENNNED